MAKDATPLATRMKIYEHERRLKVEPKNYVLVRIDGKAFHTYTRSFLKPFDANLNTAFARTCDYLLNNIQGCKMVYHQSDEISLVLSDKDSEKTSSWFDNNIQKIASVSASMTTAVFNKNIRWLCQRTIPDFAFFDARVFTMPEEDVPNYLVWRQQDWLRNSVSMLGRSKFSAKALHKKNVEEVRAMLAETDMPWEELLDVWKYGTLFTVEKHIENNEKNSVKNVFNKKFTYEDISTMLKQAHGWEN